ncbi:MAG TPA: AI-2E family transporter [Steroidobacteraceae bacterium]|nr:AI-2E family transporter [Steroidobacteraceae bacterium]
MPGVDSKKEDRALVETVSGDRAVARRVTAVRILVAGAIGLLLYFAHVAFVPVALACLFALVLSGPVEMLHGLRVPRSASAVLLMLVMLGIVAGISNMLYEPAQHWFAEAPHTVRIIERKIRPLAQFMNRVDALRNSAGNIGSAARSQTPAQAPASAPEESAPVLLLDATRGIVLSTVTVIILTLFLLAGGPPMLARMTSALVSDLASAHVISVIEHVRREVGRFYVTTALINVGLGLATGCLMMACGMPNPFLWGTIAGVLNFIPYAGSTATLILLTLVATVSFDGLGQVVAVAGSFLGLVAVEGQVIQPLLVGKRLQLNPMLVFLALWFGGLFWGIAGIILATPTLVALKVIAKRSEGGKPLLDFLSPAAGSPILRGPGR